jgi:hypothetical protein
MELVADSDIYEPSITGEEGSYTDYLPPSSKFKNGLRCPCGARKDHVFDSRQSFATHIKSKTHLKWLADLNLNKTNYYTECVSLRETVAMQKQIIAKMEKELHVKLKTIDYLTQQLMNKEHGNEPTHDLLVFD